MKPWLLNWVHAGRCEPVVKAHIMANHLWEHTAQSTDVLSPWNVSVQGRIGQSQPSSTTSGQDLIQINPDLGNPFVGACSRVWLSGERSKTASFFQPSAFQRKMRQVITPLLSCSWERRAGGGGSVEGSGTCPSECPYSHPGLWAEEGSWAPCPSRFGEQGTSEKWWT